MLVAPGGSVGKERSAAGGLLVRQGLSAGHADVVVDGDVDGVPAQSAAPDGLAAAVDAPAATGRDLADLLDLDMQQ